MGNRDVEFAYYNKRYWLLKNTDLLRASFVQRWFLDFPHYSYGFQRTIVPRSWVRVCSTIP